MLDISDGQPDWFTHDDHPVPESEGTSYAIADGRIDKQIASLERNR